MPWRFARCSQLIANASGALAMDATSVVYDLFNPPTDGRDYAVATPEPAA
jgi:hypothetical protein